MHIAPSAIYDARWTRGCTIELDDVSAALFGRREYLRVYAAVASLDGDAFVTQDICARCTVQHASTVSRALGALRAAGLLDGRNGRYTRRPSTFWTLIAAFCAEVDGTEGSGRTRVVSL